MSKTIDQRIVEMRFDNAEFERNTKQTINSLEELKKGLNLEESTRSLTNLDRAARSFSLAGISEGVDQLSNRFSNLGIVGLTVIQNLTTAAMNLSTKLARAVIDPLVSGGKKRALNIQQAKFQFEGLGMDVEKTMESANQAVLGTAYGLDEAAKLASQLGASGMRAGDEMTKALRGTAGVAAMTSSSYEDIGRIFATIAGNGRLMGDQLNQLGARGLNVAAVLGEAYGKTEQQIRDMVSKSQVSFEMFYQAMDNAFGEHATSANKLFTGSLANLRAALGRIGADVASPAFENLRDIFNALTPVVNDLRKILGPTIEEFNALSKSITNSTISKLENLDLSYLMTVLGGIRNIFKGLWSVIEPVKQAFKDVFPPATAEQLNNMAISFRVLTHNFKIGEKTAENIRKTFTGLFTIVKIGIQIFAGLVKVAYSVVSGLTPVADLLTRVTGAIGGFVSSAGEGVDVSNIFGKAIDFLSSVLRPITAMFEGLKKVLPGVLELASAIGGVFSKLASKVAEVFESFNTEKAFNILHGGLFAAILIQVEKFINTISNFVFNAGGLMPRINRIFFNLNLTLQDFQTKLKAEALLKIAGAIAILAGALWLMSTIDSNKLGSSVAAMGALFAQLFGTLAIFQKMSGGFGMGSLMTIPPLLIGISTAILILSAAMKRMSDLDWEGIAKGLVSIGALMAMIITTSKLLSSNSSAIVKGSGSLILFATSLVILTKAVEKLGGMDIASIGKGLLGIGALMAQIVIFMKVSNMDKMGVKTGVGIVLLATSLVIFAEAVKRFAAIDTSALIKGLLGVAAVLAQIVIFVNLTGNSKNVLSTAIGLTVLGAAMLIFAKAIENMGSMSWEQIGKGLLTLGASLGVVILAMQGMKGALPGAAALLVVAGALAIFAPVLKSFGSMSLEQIAKGLLTLSGVFAIFAIAGLVLAPIIPVLLGVGAAIALLGIGIAAAGAGLLAFSAGLAALAISGSAGAAALVVILTSVISLIPMVFQEIGRGIINMAETITEGIPAILTMLVTVFTAVIEALKQVIPLGVETALLFLSEILAAFVGFFPSIVQAGYDLLIAFLDGISKNIGKVVEKATDIVVNFLDGIGKMLPRIIQAGFDLLIAFIDGMTEAIEKNTPVVIDSVKRLGRAMLDAAVAILLDPLKGALDIGKNVVLGLIEGIKNKAEEAVGAITDLGSDILEGIQNFFKMRSPSRVMKDEVGRYIVQGIAEGITADMSAEQAAEKKAQNILNAFKDALGSIDISSNRLDLEYQLWAESNPNAAKGEKVARQLSLLNEKLANQQEKVNLAAAEYQTMVDNLGEASDQTKSAYNRYLQEKISLVQVSNAITELDKDATASYFDFLVKNGKEMQKMGYTAEQIEAEARKRTGYGYDPVSKAMVESVEKSVSGAMKTVTTVYEQSATKTFGTLVGNFDQWGSDYANAIGDGFLKSFQFVLTKIRTALDGMDREVNNRLARMVERIKVAMQNLDSALTISPVVDMTGVRTGIKAINTELKGVDTSTSEKKAAAVQLVGDYISKRKDDAGKTTVQNFEFIQNNTSPKALTSVEIYRRTKNQFSQLKGLVAAND